jgi:hypothetical protein
MIFFICSYLDGSDAVESNKRVTIEDWCHIDIIL